MTEKGGMGKACAACKYQRRKCSPECPLVPYFPSNKPKQFQNVHKLFGVSNILRILKQVNDNQKGDAMKSIIYQANARDKDPVYGCFGIIVLLQQEIEKLKEEVGSVKKQIMIAQQSCHSSCMQQTQPAEDSESLVSALPGSTEASVYPNYVQGYPYQGQQLFGQTENNVNIGNNFVEYEQMQQPYCEPKEAHESSGETCLTEIQCLDRVGRHEHTSEAALFSLTNYH